MLAKGEEEHRLAQAVSESGKTTSAKALSDGGGAPRLKKRAWLLHLTGDGATPNACDNHKVAQWK